MLIKADSLRILFIDGYFIDPIVFDTISKQLFSNTFASFLRCDKKHLQASVLLDRAEYESLKIELAERIDEATAAIEKLNKEKREILDGVSKQQSWVEQFRQYENVTELTRPMVIHLIERINIFEDSNIEIVFRHRNQIEEILQFISEKTADKKLLAMPIREVG